SDPGLASRSNAMSPCSPSRDVRPTNLPFARTHAMALTLACILAAGAMAQSAQTQPQQQPQAQGEQTDLAGRNFVLEFPGGTLIDYVRAVQKAAGGVNVVSAPGSEAIRLGPASLKNINVRTALETARALVIDADNESVVTNMVDKGSDPVYLVSFTR